MSDETGGSMLQVRSSGPSEGDATLILCHGFGADANDLVPLGPALDARGRLRVLFPDAPFRFPAGWGAGLAWFPEDPQEIAAFATGSAFARLEEIDPPALERAGRMLADTIGEVTPGAFARAGRSGLDASSVGDAPSDIDRDRPLVLGGFSQGSMVAVEAVLSAGVRPAGLIILSGALVARERWARLLREHEELVRGLPVFQSHGLDDPILPIAGARALGALLEEHGARREFTTFAGGHAIPAQAVEHASAWLEQFLPS